jgi:uncharacterized protein YeeX (DUF496 family)
MDKKLYNYFTYGVDDVDHINDAELVLHDNLIDYMNDNVTYDEVDTCLIIKLTNDLEASFEMSKFKFKLFEPIKNCRNKCSVCWREKLYLNNLFWFRVYLISVSEEYHQHYVLYN